MNVLIASDTPLGVRGGVISNGTGSVGRRMVKMLEEGGHQVLVIDPTLGIEDEVSLLGEGKPSFRLFPEHPNYRPDEAACHAAIEEFEREFGPIDCVHRHTEGRMGEYALRYEVHTTSSCTDWVEVLYNREALREELSNYLNSGDKLRRLLGKGVARFFRQILPKVFGPSLAEPSVEELLQRWFVERHQESSRIFFPRSLRQRYLTYDLEDEKLYPWGRGIDRKIYHPAQRGFNTLDPLFLFVGRLVDEKFPEEFLRLPGRKVCIGDGEDGFIADLKARYPESEKLQYLSYGALGDSGVADWMRKADVVVIPSRSETYCQILYQALACGCTILARDIPAMRDVVTAETGALVPIGHDLESGLPHVLKLLTLNGTMSACIKAASIFTWELSFLQFLEGLIPLPGRSKGQ